MEEWRNIKKNKESFLSLIEDHKELIIFDTETNGLKKDAKIIQFSAVKYRIDRFSLQEVDMLDLYINPEEPLPAKIVELTGITDEMLASAKTEDRAADEIFSFMRSADLWAGYNISFDLSKLAAMAERTGRYYQEDDTIDVLQMARDCIPRNKVTDHKLGTITKYLFPDDHFQFHSAIEDVRATAKCMELFLKQYLEFMPETDKTQIRVEWAHFWINPKARSQQRIRLKLTVGETGDIFYDAIKKCWSCKSGTAAKKLFKELDLAGIEEQVLRRYGWRYNASDMDLLCRNWGADVRAKAREKSVS